MNVNMTARKSAGGLPVCPEGWLEVVMVVMVAVAWGCGGRTWAVARDTPSTCCCTRTVTLR